jgi:hypothetical protein
LITREREHCHRGGAAEKKMRKFSWMWEPVMLIFSRPSGEMYRTICRTFTVQRSNIPLRFLQFAEKFSIEITFPDAKASIRNSTSDLCNLQSAIRDPRSAIRN